MSKAAFRKKARAKLILHSVLAVVTFGLYVYIEIIARDAFDRHGTGGPGGGLMGIAVVSVFMPVQFFSAFLSAPAYS